MKTTIKIQNLKCSGCENTIMRNLEALKSLKNIKINQDESAITFDYDTDLVLKKVKSRLKQIGYPEIGEDNNLGTKTKSYVSCAIGKITN
jgi:copper chaperone CopZ